MIFAQHGSRQGAARLLRRAGRGALQRDAGPPLRPSRAAHRIQLQGADGGRRPGRAARVSAPPRSARPAADVRAFPLPRPPPAGVPRRGAVRADAAAGARRHQPAVGIAGAEVHRASATRRPIACRRTTRSSSATLFPQDPLYASLLPAARAGADRPGGPGDPGGREAAARDRVQLRPSHRSVRRRAALSRAHRRHHAGARHARAARVVAAAEPPAPGAATVALLVARERAERALFHGGADGRRRRRAAARGAGRRRRRRWRWAPTRVDVLQVAPGDEIAYLRLS